MPTFPLPSHPVPAWSALPFSFLDLAAVLKPCSLAERSVCAVHALGTARHEIATDRSMNDLADIPVLVKGI
jgi:hypothetical protein